MNHGHSSSLSVHSHPMYEVKKPIEPLLLMTSKITSFHLVIISFRNCTAHFRHSMDTPRIRANSLGRACVRQLPSVSWLPWIIAGCTSRQSKCKRSQAWILKGVRAPCQTNPSENSLISMFLPNLRFTKYPGCSPRGKQGCPLAQRAQVK